MSFKFVSSLPSPTSKARNDVSSFQCDIDSIKQLLTEIGNNYLLVAYRVYEMSFFETYKPYYKNISEACYAELGFKKSTTYNLIAIVKRFGVPELDGYIPYSSLFGSNVYSYSQLTEMLSLSDKQLEKVSPEMSVRDIKQLKRDSKISSVSSSSEITAKDDDVVPEEEQTVIDVSFQTSGKFLVDSVTGLSVAPCPFCGSYDLCLDFIKTTYSITCRNCQIDFDFCSSTFNDDSDFTLYSGIIEQWNKRKAGS